MNTENYQSFVQTTAIYPDSGSKNTYELMYLAMGLCSESGEVANKIKKIYRDGSAIPLESLAGELGDVAWYWFNLCNALGLDAKEVLQLNMAKLESRKDRGVLGGSGDTR